MYLVQELNVGTVHVSRLIYVRWCDWVSNHLLGLNADCKKRLSHKPDLFVKRHKPYNRT